MKKEGGLESEAVIRRRYSINGVFFNLSNIKVHLQIDVNGTN